MAECDIERQRTRDSSISSAGGTREWIIEAFGGLLATSKGYHAIRVADLTEEAGVGRSTFYEHFRNKDDVLGQSMAHLLAILSTAVEQPDAERIAMLLAHFRENRTMCLGLLRGTSAQHLKHAFAELLEQRLLKRCSSVGDGEDATRLQVIPASRQIAAAQLALIGDWLDAPMPAAEPASVARAMIESSRAIAAAYVVSA